MRNTFKETASAPWRLARVDDWAMARPTFEEVRRGGASFKENTSVGACSVRPRWLGLLSDELIEIWIDLLMPVERRGMWPSAVITVLVNRLPKPT